MKRLSSIPPFKLTSEQLFLDLFRAYKDARKQKRSKDYQVRFEMNQEGELVKLRNELLSHTYQPQYSTCFIIHDPKMREVFAAQFRDRVVHHLLYNYVHVLFERTFIADSYSCIKNKGTHYGIHRLEHHIRSESDNWHRPCWVLKIDISGYFMHIHRQTLLDICKNTLMKMRNRPSDTPGLTWGQKIDYDFVLWLLELIVMLDPVKGCSRVGELNEWSRLSKGKSLFDVDEGCGLPIGNLTSQLFSNVYLNVFDQYVKRELGIRHYGRYVDDAYIVSRSKERLREVIPLIDKFLNERLRLTLSRNKCQIKSVQYGTAFVGAYVRPYRTYVANSTMKRMRRKNEGLVYSVVCHYPTYRLSLQEELYKESIS